MKDGMMDFLLAALPWIVMGLSLAIFFANGGGKKEKQDTYGTEGMCIGMCLGTALGAVFGYNTGLGISMGMLLGLAVGSSIRKEEADEGADK